MKNIFKIEELCTLRFGFYGQPKPDGKVSYLQVRQFNNQGRLTTNADEYIVSDSKTRGHFLRDGDVLFVGKGNRLFAWCYRATGQPMVASSVFFVLSPDIKVIYPEYLSAILNAPQSKATFQQIGGGTNIFSIRKSELGAFQIPVPPIQEQKKIAAIAELHQQEIQLAHQLIAQKKNLYTSIISKLIK